MKKITLSVTTIIFSMNVLGQVPPVQWQNSIGGAHFDYLNSIVQTSGGGYMCGGNSYSNISGDKTENSMGSMDYWLVKLDGAGNIQWQNTIGGSATDEMYCIAKTADGGYICGGYSLSDSSGDKTEDINGLNDYWVVKLNTAGNIQWQNNIGGSGQDILNSVSQTADGGYICGGFSASPISGDKTEANWDIMNSTADYWVIKLDSSGNIQWQNTIGGTNMEKLFSVSQTTDGGYICGGLSSSSISGDKTEVANGADDYWVIKLDASGNIQWQNAIGGGGFDDLYSIAQTTDGGYICGGYSTSNIGGDKTENSNGSNDYWVIKLDASGNILWQNTIGGSGSDLLYSILQTADGGYLCGGWSTSNISGDKTESSRGFEDYWIVKLNANGVVQWDKTLGGADLDFVNQLVETSDGGFIIAGDSESNISGDKTENCIGLWDFWVVKFGPATGISEVGKEENNIYPNPAATEIRIKNAKGNITAVEIFNTLGEKVYTYAETSGSTLETINVRALSSGIYFVRVRTSDGMRAGKFVKE